jgi:electron transfer flavoprotein beta subunit
MKIVVCVKHVPEGTGGAMRIDPQTKRLDRSGEGALNHFDANAVEEALRVKEATGDGEVVVLSLGPDRAVDSLRKALAMGADRAVLVSDDGAVGSDLVASGRVLADGTVAGSAGGLTAAALDPTLFLLDFPGYDAALEHVVLGQPVASAADAQPSTFEVIPALSPGDGIAVRVKKADGTPVPDGFMVRIEQLGGVA